MRYELEQGPTEDLIIEQAVRMRMPIPSAIADKPRLLPGLQFYYYAFNCLSSDRDYSVGVGRIPWTAAATFSDKYKLSLADFERLWDLICHMDSVYVNHKAKLADTPRPTDPTKAPAVTGPRR